MATQEANYHLNSMGKIEFLINSPKLTQAETVQKCRTLVQMKPACVWVKPCYVQPVVALMRCEGVQVGTVIGCSDGSTHTQIKVAEAKRALTEGALQLAAPLNVGFTREETKQDLQADLHAMSGIAHMNGATFEIILKPDFLNIKEMLKGSLIAGQADVDVISFPINELDEDWVTNLVTPLKKQFGVGVTLKGLLQHATPDGLQQFFTKGLDRLGIIEISPKILS